MTVPGMALNVLLFAQEPLKVRFTADCRDGKIKFSCQFPPFVENRVEDLVDSNWFSSLAFVIRKSAIVILSEGKTMSSVVKVSRCTILATCQGAFAKFTERVSIDESALPYCQGSRHGNV
jgi:hypothetical protein